MVSEVGWSVGKRGTVAEAVKAAEAQLKKKLENG